MLHLDEFKQKGTALVEFAIVAPLMIFLLLGVAELGRAFNQYNIMTKTVRDGARYASSGALLGSLGTVMLTGELVGEVCNTVVYGTPIVASPLLPEWVTGTIVVEAPDADHSEYRCNVNGVPIVTVKNVDDYHVEVTATYQYRPLLGANASLPTFGLGNGPIPLAFTFHATVIMRAI